MERLLYWLTAICDGQVWSKGSLDATIAGSGNITYFGSPTVTQKVAGSGKVTGQGNK